MHTDMVFAGGKDTFGKILPVVGKICMDQCMIDATNADNIKVDDIVTIMREDNGVYITASDIASQMGTINCEIV